MNNGRKKDVVSFFCGEDILSFDTFSIWNKLRIANAELP